MVDNRTLAVVVCHLYGYLADLDVVREIAAPQGIPVIDDAAQAMGADFRGKPAGTCGDAGLFSLSRGKNINAVDGGIIVTDREDLAGVLERFTLPDAAEGTPRLFLKALLLSALLRPSLYWLPRSLPFLNLGASVYDPVFPCAPFTSFQAGIARRMLARLQEITAGRRRVARDLCTRLSRTPGVAIIAAGTNEEPVYPRLPVLVSAGRSVREVPELGVVRSYPTPLTSIPALRPHLRNCPDVFAGAEHLADRILTLPTHRFVTGYDLKRIVDYCGRLGTYF